MISFVKTSDGYASFDGEPDEGRKLAAITTREYRGTIIKGREQMDVLPESQWTIHFCSPSMKFDQLREMAAALPLEP